MAKATLSPLQRQVARVSRRLFLQATLDTLVWCWTGAFILAGAWFLVQTFLLSEPPSWLRWTVAGSLLGVATVLAVVLAWLRAPSRISAALALDKQFELRERVVTAVTLPPELQGTPAGQALFEDANQRIAQIDKNWRYPLNLSWQAVVPVGAAVLAGIALFVQAPRSAATVTPKDDSKAPPANAKAIEEKRQELRKKLAERRETAARKSDELEKLETELEKIANRPHDSKEQLRERLKEMTSLEDQMKNREKELADRTKSLQQQLQQMDKLTQKSSLDGPAKDLDKALSQGKLEEAKRELDKLAKKLENNELTQKEKEQLQKQLEELQKKLERAANLKDKEEKLKSANLDPETLKREMNRLEQEKRKLSDMKDLADKLGQCQQKLKEGNMEEAAQSMKAASDKAEQMELDEQDLASLKDQLARLGDEKEEISKGIDPNVQDSDFENAQAVPGAGRRPLGEKGPTKSYDAKARVEFDPKGKKIFDGYAPGQNFKKKSGADMAGEIKQASQEAPEAVEQQRIPRAYRDSAKGFYRKLREQTETEKK